MKSISLDGVWRLALDPQNVGREQGWFDQLPEDTLGVPVPGVLEQAAPGYDGVAWYSRAFHLLEWAKGKRVHIRFGAADYYAEVWLNGRPIGCHEGGATPFTLDATHAARFGAQNILTVRVIDTANERIDGFLHAECPHGRQTVAYRTGCTFYNYGGLWQQVELLVQNDVYIKDVHLRPFWPSGDITAAITLHHQALSQREVEVRLAVSPAGSGEPVTSGQTRLTLDHGRTTWQWHGQVARPAAWNLEAPNLYRCEATVLAGDEVLDQATVRFGFRHFTFRNGRFELNEEPLTVKGVLYNALYPISLARPLSPSMLQRDVVLLKEHGFNLLRAFTKPLLPEMLDLCDELGLLVYEETGAAWGLADSPHVTERFLGELRQLVMRDRSRACVVAWGIANETGFRPFDAGIAEKVFPEAFSTIRELDPDRVIITNSGTWHRTDVGPICLPGKAHPEPLLHDVHLYLDGAMNEHLQEVLRTLAQQELPTATQQTIAAGRNDIAVMKAHLKPYVDESSGWVPWGPLGGGIVGNFWPLLQRAHRPLFLSEFGAASFTDVQSVLARLAEAGSDHEDTLRYREVVERLREGYQRYGLAQHFGTLEQFCQATQAFHAQHLGLQMAAVRTNPGLAGYIVTSWDDSALEFNGMVNVYREPKQALKEAARWNEPVVLNVIASPVNLYPGQSVRLLADLAHEGGLADGPAEVDLRVLDEQGRTAMREMGEVCLRGRTMRVAEREVMLGDEAGIYRIEITVRRDAETLAAGTATVQRFEPWRLATDRPVMVWEDEPQLEMWLRGRGIQVARFGPRADPSAVVLVGKVSDRARLERLAQWGKEDGRLVFLDPEAFAASPGEPSPYPFEGDVRLEWCSPYFCPVAHAALPNPAFAGLPAPTLLDNGLWRYVFPSRMFVGLPNIVPAAVAYDHREFRWGVTLGTVPNGDGEAVVSGFNLLPYLGRDPVADRLVANLSA